MNQNQNQNSNTNNNGPMQAKTIEKICKGKIYDWAKSVEKDSPEVAEIIKTKTMITGGAIVSLLSGERVNDFDIYLKDRESVIKVAEYYVKKFKEQNHKWINEKVSRFEVVSEGDRVKILIKSSGVASSDGETASNQSVIENQSSTEYQYFEGTRGDEAETYLQSLVNNAAKENKNYAPIFLSDNAITLSNQIQIVIRFFGEPEEVHRHYDFTHVTNVYTVWDNKLTLNIEALECIRTKTLKYKNSLYPICSLFRLRKFISRGWKISAGEILKIVWAVKALNLDDIDVLTEQIIGVDQAYFMEMLAILRKDQIEGKSIDQTYISNLIDTVFDF